MVGSTELVCSRQAALLRRGHSPHREQILRKKDRTVSFCETVSSCCSSLSCSSSVVNEEENSRRSARADAAARPVACAYVRDTRQPVQLGYFQTGECSRRNGEKGEKELTCDSVATERTGEYPSKDLYQLDLSSSSLLSKPRAKVFPAVTAVIPCGTQASITAGTATAAAPEAAAAGTVVPSTAAAAARAVATTPAVAETSVSAAPPVRYSSTETAVRVRTAPAAAVSAAEAAEALGAVRAANSNLEANSSVPEGGSCCSGTTQNCTDGSNSRNLPSTQSNNDTGSKGGRSHSSSKQGSRRSVDCSREDETATGFNRSKGRHYERDLLHKNNTAAETCSSKKPSSTSSGGSTHAGRNNNPLGRCSGNGPAHCHSNTADCKSGGSSSCCTGDSNSKDARSSGKSAARFIRKENRSTRSRGGSSRRNSRSRRFSMSQLVRQERENGRKLSAAGTKKRSSYDVTAAAAQQQLQQSLGLRPARQAIGGGGAAAATMTTTSAGAKHDVTNYSSATTALAAAASPAATPATVASFTTAAAATAAPLAPTGRKAAETSAAAARHPAAKRQSTTAAAEPPGRRHGNAGVTAGVGATAPATGGGGAEGAAAETCSGAAVPAASSSSVPGFHSIIANSSGSSHAAGALPHNCRLVPSTFPAKEQMFHRVNIPAAGRAGATRKEEMYTTRTAAATVAAEAAGPTAAPTSFAAPGATALCPSDSFFDISSAASTCQYGAVRPVIPFSQHSGPSTAEGDSVALTELPAAGTAVTASDAAATAVTYTAAAVTGTPPAPATSVVTSTRGAAANTTAAPSGSPPTASSSRKHTFDAAAVAARGRRSASGAAAASNQKAHAATGGKVAVGSSFCAQPQSVSSISTSPSSCASSSSDCLDPASWSTILSPPAPRQQQGCRPVPAPPVATTAAPADTAASAAASVTSATSSGTPNVRAAASSTVPKERPTDAACGRGTAAFESTAGDFKSLLCAPISSCYGAAGLPAPPPFPPLPVTCGVSPPADTVLLRDLQMLRLQRVLRTAAAQRAKGGQQQQPHTSKTAQQRQQEHVTPQEDPAWLKNFSGWVLLRLPPSSAALSGALATVKGSQQRDRGGIPRDKSAAASTTAAGGKKDGALRNAGGGVRGKKKKQREGGCGGAARLRAASAAATAAAQAVGNAATAGGTAGRGAATAAAKGVAEEIKKGAQQAAKLQNGGCAARQRRTCSISSDFTCTAATTAADTSLKFASDVLMSQGGSRPREASHPSTSDAKTKSKDSSSSTSSTSSRSVTSSGSVSSSSSCYRGSSMEVTGAGRGGGGRRGKGVRERGQGEEPAALETALWLPEAEVYMSRQTLLQTSGPRLSGFVDRNGKGVRVQRHVVEQILASAAPRFVFEQFHAQGVQMEPSLARYLEKRRIQSTLRRLKEHIEMKLQEASAATGAPAEDFDLVFLRFAKAAAAHCPSSCSLPSRDRGSETKTAGTTGWAAIAGSSSGGDSSAAGELLSQLEIQQQGMCAALEAFDWWAPGLNEQDKKEIFFAIATAGVQQQRQPSAREEEERKLLPRSINQQAWISAFRFLPFNLPDWPVPLSSFPSPSETLRPLLPFLAAPSCGCLGDRSVSRSCGDSSGHADSSSSSNPRGSSLCGGQKSSSSPAEEFNCGSDAYKLSRRMGDSSSAGVRSSSSRDTRNCQGAGSSMTAPVCDEWAAAAGARSNSRTATCALRCSRFFVLSKPQSIVADAAAAGERNRRQQPCCCCIYSGKPSCSSPKMSSVAAAAGASAAGVGAVTSAGRLMQSASGGGISPAPDCPRPPPAAAVADSFTAEDTSTAKVGDSQTAASTETEAPVKVCGVPMMKGKCVCSTQRNTEAEINGEPCMQQEGQWSPAAGAMNTSASTRAAHCCRMSPAASPPSSPEPCLCGVLHLCRVALLICEAFCEPVALRFPHFLTHLISSKDSRPPSPAAEKSRQLSAEEGVLPRSSVARSSAVKTAYAPAPSNNGSSSSKCGLAAAAAATPQDVQHEPGTDAAAVSHGEQTGEKGQRSPGCFNVNSEVSPRNPSGLLAQAVAVSQQQRRLGSWAERHFADAAATATAETQGCAIAKNSGGAYAATNGNKPTGPSQHTGTVNILDSCKGDTPLSCVLPSSAPSSLSPCFSATAKDGPMTTGEEDRFFGAGRPSRTVPSPYPPSRPLLCLMMHTVADQQQSQLTAAALSEGTTQRRRELGEMREGTVGQQGQQLQTRQQLSEQQQQQQQQRTVQVQKGDCAGSTALPTQVMIPAWHLEQDFLLSRLVSLEELQGVLRVLLPAGWVLAGLQLVIGAATAALSPLEWLSLLHPCSSVASSVDLDDVVSRFNAQHPLSSCYVGCSFSPAALSPSSPAQSCLPRSSQATSQSAAESSPASPSSSLPQQSQDASQQILPALAALVSQRQRRVERKCACYSQMKWLRMPSIEGDTDLHKKCIMTHGCVAATSINGNIQKIHRKPRRCVSLDREGSVVRAVASADHSSAFTSTERKSVGLFATAAAAADAVANQHDTRHSCGHSTKQETTDFISVTAVGDCCGSRDNSRVRSRSGESRGVSSSALRENTWVQTRDNRSRLGLHWWSFLSPEGKNIKRGEAREHRRTKKRDTSASGGQPLKGSRTQDAVSSTTKTRSHTCIRQGCTASDTNVQESLLHIHSVSGCPETQRTTAAETPLCGNRSAVQKREFVLKSNGQQSRPCSTLQKRSTQEDRERTDTRENAEETGNQKTRCDDSTAQEQEADNAQLEVAIQATACIKLHIESLFASDKARKAFDKLSAAALSSSVVELGMPANAVDTLVSLVRTGGSCCLDLYAVIACCKLFFRIFKDGHILQVLHDLI